MLMVAWVFRFGLFGVGNPGSGVWAFVLSMIVYGIAFDFFNISGSLFVERETDKSIRSSSQGLFMMMTNGLGATIGMFAAQAIVNHFIFNLGRYWNEGPIHYLYVSSGLLKEKNEFIVFETENVKIEELTLLDHPVYKK